MLYALEVEKKNSRSVVVTVSNLYLIACASLCI